MSFRRIRQPKMTTQALLDFDLGESSSDSDFRIEDHDSDEDPDSNDDGNSSENSSEENESDSDDLYKEHYSDNSHKNIKQNENEDCTNPVFMGSKEICKVLQKLDTNRFIESKLPAKSICCVCLGDRSDDSNEIIECDGCGVSVHEGCYGVNDNVSISSTNSTCSTEPWFCEACRAGVLEPNCELCPNKGGIYKETDVGKWVHLICALYVPGVAFGEVDQLSSVTLFEMPYSKWGAKVCSLCETPRFARTGVCIGCDAGMCKTYFHVTCAQTAGFLTEAHHEEADAADPFFAHCKVHSEKEMIKRRKRNYHNLRLNMQEKQKGKKLQKFDDPCPAQLRIQRKLLKYQSKYSHSKQLKPVPWVPTQKMSRLLTTSASACKRLLAKADIMAVDVELLERQEAQIAALTDIRKKWHIAPAFSVEFIGYYLDRISRTHELKLQLSDMMENNLSLSNEQDLLRTTYDARLDMNKDLKSRQESLTTTISQLHKEINFMCPNKIFPSPSNIGHAHYESNKSASTPPSRPISVPTAAALKMGVGFPLVHLGPPGTKVDSIRLLSTHAKSSPIAGGGASSAPSTPTLNVQTFECGICKRTTDQHLLAKCDTCKLHYHLSCLNPPLTRHPKKSKLYGWQCSECDKSEDSEDVADMPKGPRKSRTRFNKDGSIIALPESESDNGPTHKRRSIDTLQFTKNLTKKNKPNNSFSTSNKSDENSKTTPKMYVSSTSILGKKSKCYVPLQNIKKAIKSPAQQTQSPVLNKNITQIVHTSLSDEPLLLVLPSVTTTREIVSIQTPDPDPLALPVNTNTTIPSMEDLSDPIKSGRKQKRKDKHRSKHIISSDTEKSPIKEHKRKRKKKLHGHDIENPQESIPKIKIKFKTLPLPGEVTPEAQFFYVSADMVRSAEEASRPTSVETVEDSAPVLVEKSPVGRSKSETMINSPELSVTKTPITRKTSPRKTAGKRNSLLSHSKSTTIIQLPSSIVCCICKEVGSGGNAVTCDECHKHYHFTCLDPPLKKTPKIRGYSWHCADCDPTDEEKI
ncbi:PHD finger protein 14 [Bactrocera neohumeralis]|uniref:PHD finger protein 14 n=1 Tax=Bactrocera neohumeralis TaxID=98809 RepID=UPI001A95FF1D|nr:PHD finger protein 14 isoform X1 [Bactrocera tryoni]XP_050338761.1 PHD finger protein 14 [Bactrocera neohumeralis]